jgi:O-antigen ligase
VRAPDADPTAFHAHSIYLTFFAEIGIVGLAAFAWTIWRFATELRRRVSEASPPAAFLSLSIAAGLVGVAVQGLIDTVSVVLFGVWMPMMALALAAARGGEPSPTADR